MKRLMAFIAVTSGTANAAWTQVDADALRTTFVDSAAVQREGKISRMVSMVEFSRFQRMVEVGYFSQKLMFEYDCESSRYRRYAQVFHAGHMGEGSAVYSDEAVQEWTVAAEGSVTEKILRMACK